jgi:hypothetical protein
VQAQGSGRQGLSEETPYAGSPDQSTAPSKFCERVDVDFADPPLGLRAADMPKGDVTLMSR